MQVEHPVTEEVTGVDLVRAQINIAKNEYLELKQNDVEFNGHALEVRLYAENPNNDFLPETGKVVALVDLTGLSNETDLGSREAVLNGIAWDERLERLFVTGKHWSNLFQIELVKK